MARYSRFKIFFEFWNFKNFEDFEITIYSIYMLKLVSITQTKSMTYHKMITIKQNLSKYKFMTFLEFYKMIKQTYI